MKKKNGFTLIELLAVIIILAVVGLIAFPMVLDIIDDAKKETFEKSSLNIFKSAELYEAQNNFEMISIDGINITDNNFPLEKNTFTSGKIIRNEFNELELINVTDGVFCAKGVQNNLIAIKGSCDELDPTAPINTSVTIDDIRSNSFRVIVSSEDLESGIKSYEFSIDGTNYISKNNNNHTFNNLALNKTYTLYVRVTNNNGLKTDVISKDVTTKDIVVPTYNIDKTGWQTSKDVTITYPEKETGFVYSYSIDGGETWTTVSSGTTANVTFTSNGNVIARIYDGTNYKTASSYTVTQIDTTAPADVSIALSLKTTNTITVIATGIDTESGITKYEFSIDGGAYVSNGINATYTFTNVTTGNHSVKVRVTNGSGLTTESTILTVSPNDITAPTYSIDKSGWQTSKDVTITYPEKETGFVYSYSIDGGETWTTVSSGTTANVTFTSNGNVIARIYDGTNYKTASSYTVTQIDTTAPTDVSIALSLKTTNTITVIATGIDTESGITKYEFSIDGGAYVSNGINATYTFTNVTTGNHSVKVRVTNGSGLTTESTVLTVSPNDITAPTYSIDKSGWQTQKVVTITYPTIQTGFIYEYSVNGGSSWTTVSSGTTTNVTFTSNGNVIARVYDGTNYKTASSYSVSQIDTEAPNIILGTNGNTIYLKQHSTTATISDNENINTSSLKYIWTTSKTEPAEISFTKTFANNGTINTEALATGNYYLWVMAKDEAGNKKVIVSNVFNLDNTKPVVTLAGSNNVTLYLGDNYIEAGAAGTDPHSGINGTVTITGTVNANTIGTYYINYSVSDKAGNISDTVVRTVNVISNVFSYDYTGNYQTFTALKTGKYKIELWGAQGGYQPNAGPYYDGAPAAYTRGTINLTAGNVIYIYVGQKGLMNVTTSSFNGGGGATASDNYCTQGGGATDVRLISGTWNDVSGLRSRIMVAAGGGGSERANPGGYGGALIGGYNGANSNLAGTQTSGYAFGYGEKGVGGANGSGAGGGYYGGRSSHDATNQLLQNGGGSSFISGYTGCNAINSSGVHTGQPNHYSGHVFYDMQMIAGNASMPKPSGGTETGHTGNGYARITFIP